MITEADILLLHELSIVDFGGAKETRDRELLRSAIARPFQTFDSSELYPTPIEKAAALSESIIINHPFIDGNKRTAMLAMLSLLNEYNLSLHSTPDSLYDLIIGMSTGQLKFDDIVSWLSLRVNAI